MHLDEYSDANPRIYDYSEGIRNINPNLLFCIIGLAGEAGEIADFIKKIARNRDGTMTDDDRRKLLLELGDVLWYVDSAARELDSSLTEVARMNMQKLSERKARGTIRSFERDEG